MSGLPIAPRKPLFIRGGMKPQRAPMLLWMTESQRGAVLIRVVAANTVPGR
jgi:hypothetical protein